jgi:hypothetical protein
MDSPANKVLFRKKIGRNSYCWLCVKKKYTYPCFYLPLRLQSENPMRKLLFFILFLYSTINYAQDGLSPSTAFTNLGHVNDPAFSSGTYNFNINSVAFTSIVDDTGWILLASGRPTPNQYEESTSLTLQSNSILPSEVFENNDDIIELRINGTSGPNTPFEVSTNNSIILDNLKNNLTLSNNYNGDGGIWSGTDFPFMAKDCPGYVLPLSQAIYHACNNHSGLHWLPIAYRSELTYDAPVDNDLNLWIKAAPVTPTQDGLTPSTAFTNLGHVNNPAFIAGSYYFNINGVAFTSVVDDTGWILLASGTPTPNQYEESTAIALQSNSILPPEVFQNNENIIEVRITGTSGPNTPFEVSTNNSIILDNLKNNLTLSNNYNGDGSIWSGAGFTFMAKSCTGSVLPLSQAIYHACNNGNGLHWKPIEYRSELTFNAPVDNDLNLWIKATPVIPAAVPTLSQWGIIALSMIMLIFGVVALKYSTKFRLQGK